MPDVFIEFSDGTEFSVDAVESIAPVYSQAASSNFVEEGVDISDHVRPQPLSLSLTCYMGDAPLYLESGPEPRVYDPDADGPHRQIHERLEQAAVTGERITVDCSNKGLYENLVILNYAPVWDNQHGNSLQFSLQLQQFLTANTETKKLKTGETPESSTGKSVDPEKAKAADPKLKQGDADQRRFTKPVRRGRAPEARANETPLAEVTGDVIFQQNLENYAAQAFSL